MDKATAKKIIELAKAAKADRWYVRRPTPEMKAHFGSNMHPLLVQRKEGKMPYDQDILADDYGVTSEELREAHIEFILIAAENLAELAQFWLTYAEDVGADSPDPATPHGQ
jgi:hypothetical protein